MEAETVKLALILDYLAYASNARLKQYLPKHDFQTKQSVEYKNLSAPNFLAYEVVLEEPSVRLTVQIFFEEKTALVLAQEKTGLEADTIDLSLASDSVFEFLNFFGGHTRTLFDYVGFDLVMRPIERLLAKDKIRPLNPNSAGVKSWRLEDNVLQLIFIAHIQVINVPIFDVRTGAIDTFIAKLDSAAEKIMHRIGAVEPIN